MSRARLAAAALALTLLCTALAAAAAWPIYQAPRLWWVAACGALVAFLLVWLGSRLRWGALTLVAPILAFALLVVPLAVPRALPSDPAALLAEPMALVRGLGDGLAAVALGWKQLLTLTLPVGSYQAVTVPFLVTVMVSVALATGLTLRGGRAISFAALPLLLPVLFGTVFGSSAVSAPLHLGPLTIHAPRELGLWLSAGILCAAWVAWASGIERRAALRRGRAAAAEPGPDTVAGFEAAAALAVREGAASSADVDGKRARRRSRTVRGMAAAATAVVALSAGALASPALDSGERTVPRDRVDPEIVVRDQSSPLAGYRSWKRDTAFAAPLFTVDSDGELPQRMRIAVLDEYDGVDFTTSDGTRFTRFPSGEDGGETAEVTVRIDAGYTGIWVPLSPPLADPPSFAGARASDLADGFYLNRDSAAAVAVPTRDGLREGDAYRAPMSVAEDTPLPTAPADTDPLVDLEALPELSRWVHAQDLPSTGEGLRTAVERLRARGYLSHSLTDAEGEREWLLTLTREHGTRFVPSSGGHSVARVEQLFAQLNEQQRLAGDGADDAALVAAIGDDEQFAAAAALIARAMGFESRVVLGVRLGDENAGVPGVPACAESCAGENVAAWVEVRGGSGAAGGGAAGPWAPLDVTPQVTNPPTSLVQGEQLPEFPTLPEERDATESDPPLGMTDQQSSDSEEEPDEDVFALWPLLRAVGLGLAALVLLALPLLFIPAAKRIRTRARRRAADPELRVLGAWDELLDAYAAVGTTAGAAARGTRAQIAAALDLPNGAELAALVDYAVYSREGVHDGDADRAWELAAADIAGLRATLGRWGRLRAAFSLRTPAPARSTAQTRGAAKRRTRRIRGTR